MAETVDTRVVEAKFDSKQFEQGVDKTVKKLDELKKSLNMSDTGKSVAEIGNKISETTEKASGSLEKLQERFTNFTGMLKQKLLSGIADEIVGVFFKIENGVKSLVTSLSSAQVGVGMQRYTDILTSVRTLVSAGVDQDTSYAAVERLGEYADQTSYSLDELVSTMSKFKTAGADIDTARRMVEGLSNAAASMGVNAQQAGRAYLNMQQAYSKGAMLQNDWISFESLPMVGEKFNEQILKAAVKVGTLKETTAGVYKTVKNIDKQVKTSGADSKGITAQNMGTKLSSRWFNKKVMEEVFGNSYYFEAIERDELNRIKAAEERMKAAVKEGTMTQEQMDNDLQAELDKLSAKRLAEKKKELDEALAEGKIKPEEYKKQLEDFNKSNVMTVFGYNAFRAGQEARSLNDVLLTLKDTISRGWAQSFEYIFGRLDEAADFFTALTESNLANAIYSIGEIRNAILEIWAAPTENGNGGKENILKGLQTMDDLLGDIFEKIGLIRREEKTFFDQQMYNQISKQEGKDAAEKYKKQMEDLQKQWNESSPFDEFVTRAAHSLEYLSRKFNNFMESVRSFLTRDLVFGETRLTRIANVIEGIKEALHLVFYAAKGLFDEVIKPLGENLFTNLEKVIQPIYEMINPKNQNENGENIFTKAKDAIDNILIIGSKVVTILSPVIDILGDVLNFIVELGTGTVYTNLEFFADTLGLVSELLFNTSAQDKKGQGVIKGLGDSIKELGDACKDAFKFVFDFFDSIIKDVRVLIGLDEGELQEGGVFSNISNFFENNEFLKKVKESFDTVVSEVKGFITDFPNRIAGIGISIGDFFKSIFYEKETTMRYNGSMLEEVETGNWIEKPLTAWLKQAVEDVKNFITVEVPKFVLNIPSLVGSFLESIFYEKTGKMQYNGSMLEEVKIRTPLKKWLDKVIIDVRRFIKDIPNKIKNIPNLAKELFRNIFYEKQRSPSVTNAEYTWVRKPFTAWVDDNLIKPLKEFMGNLPTYIGQGIGTVGNLIGKIVGAIFGKADGSEATGAEVQTELEKPFTGIDINGILSTIKEIGKKIINGIVSVFSGTDDWETNKNWFAEKIAGWIDAIRVNADKAWQTVRGWFIALPGKIGSIFTGENAESTTETGTIGSAISKWIHDIGVWLSDIPNMLLGVWESTEKQVGTIWNNIIGWITGKNVKKNELNSFNQSIYDTMVNNKYYDTAEMFKESALNQQWRDDNPIAANISDFFKHLISYAQDKIVHLPTDIANGLNTAAGIFGGLLEKATGWFNGNAEQEAKDLTDDDGVKSSFLEALASLGETLKKGITETLPNFISSGINYVKNHYEEWANAFVGLFNGGTATARQEVEKLGDTISGFFKTVFKEETFDPTVFAQYMESGRIAEGLEYENRTKNPILEFFRGVVSKVGEIFNSVGPVILDGIKKGIEWVGTQLGNFTDMLGKEVTDENGEKLSFIQILDKKFTDDQGNENPLWTKIKEVGSAIMTFMIDTIPKFISAAVQEIAKQVPEILGGLFSGEGLLGSLFGGKNSNVPEEQAGALVDPMLAMFKSDEEYGKKYKEEALDNAEALVMDYSKRIHEIAEKYGVSVDEAESMLFGNTAATGLSALIGGAFADEFVTEGQLQNLEKQLELKQKIKEQQDLITEANEKLMNLSPGTELYDEAMKEKEAAEQAIKELETLGTTTAKAGKEEKKTEPDQKNFMDGVTTFVSGFGDLISTIGNTLSGETGKTVATLLSVAAVLYVIRDIFSLTDELETIKGIVFGTVFGALVGLIGYITYLSQTGSDVQWQRVEKILDSLTTLITMVTVIVGMWKGTDFISDLLGLGGDAKKLTQLSGMKDVFANGILSIFGGIAEAASDAVFKPLEYQGIADVVLTTMEQFSGTILDISTSVTQAIDMVTGYLEPAIQKMNELGDLLPKAIAAIPDIKTFVKEFSTMMLSNWFAAKQTENGGASFNNFSYVLPTGDILKAENFEGNLRIINMISSIANELVHAVSGLASVSSTEEAVSKLKTVLTLVNTEEFAEIYTSVLSKAYSLVAVQEQIGSKYDTLPSSQTVMDATRFIADVLSIFSVSINDISDIKLTELNHFFDLLEKLINGTWMANNTLTITNTGLMNWIFGDTSLSAFGKVLSNFAIHLTSVFRNLNTVRGIIAGNDEVISQKEVDDFKSAVDLISQFTSAMLVLGYDLSKTTTKNDSNFTMISLTGLKDKAIPLYEELLPRMAQMIGKVMVGMSSVEGFGDDTVENVRGAIDTLNMITTMLTTDLSYYDGMDEKFNKLADALFGEDGNGGLIGRMKDAGQGWGREMFGGISDFIDMIDQLSKALETFYTKDETGKFNYETGLANVAETLLNILGPNNVTDQWVMPKITPVLDLEDFEKKVPEMKKLLNFMVGDDGQWRTEIPLSIIPDIELPQTHDYTETLSHIEDYLKNIDSSTGAFNSSLSGLRIEMNGQTVGYIVAPFVSEWQGAQSFINWRGDMTHNYDTEPART